MIETLTRVVTWIDAAEVALDDLLRTPAEFDAVAVASLCGRASLCNRTLRRLQRRLQLAGLDAVPDGDKDGAFAEHAAIERARIALERSAGELAELQSASSWNQWTAETLSGLAAIIHGMRKDLAAAKQRGRFQESSHERN